MDEEEVLMRLLTRRVAAIGVVSETAEAVVGAAAAAPPTPIIPAAVGLP